MKTIKRALAVVAWVCAIGLLAFACSDELDVYQAYRFELVTMPVQKTIRAGETAEIRCTLVREGEYRQVRFYIRMFQPDGRGVLRMEDGTELLPNDLYPLEKDVFRLYYTSHCEEQQTVDVYIEDSFGQLVQKTFTFQSEKVAEQDG